MTQSYPADFEATLLQLGLATSTSSFSATGALDGEELLHVELDPRGVSSNRQELRIECWKVQFRHFRIEFFWQELDIVLVGPGLQQNSTTNQAAPAPGP